MIFIFSISGGKDSSVMLQLAAIKAREMNVKFSVLYVDFEAQYKATIDHVEELIDEVSDVIDTWYWIALPLSLRNAVSVIQPKWICWDNNDKAKWVRNMPTGKYNK
ncbi:MAG: phosphoadenosine phosphosulfate reductase family protein [Bacilli bacterium]